MCKAQCPLDLTTRINNFFLQNSPTPHPIKNEWLYRLWMLGICNLGLKDLDGIFQEIRGHLMRNLFGNCWRTWSDKNLYGRPKAVRHVFSKKVYQSKKGSDVLIQIEVLVTCLSWPKLSIVFRKNCPANHIPSGHTFLKIFPHLLAHSSFLSSLF